MAITQEIHDQYALYLGDCIEVMPKMPKESIGMSVYSPPFSGLYNYSSAPEDMSNCADDKKFLEHYDFLVEEISRVTMPGRHTIVHCMDLPKMNHTLSDFPGDIIRLHARHGFQYAGRHTIWKEPLGVFIRTRSLNLSYRQLMKDSSISGVAGADYVLIFRKVGTSVPIPHPQGILEYMGARQPPPGMKEHFANWPEPRTNKFAHWVWQQYASSIWDDIRLDNVLPYKASRDPDDEKHIHPLQLDVIERCLILRSNPGDTVFTPFMGVGSEVYGALKLGRKAIGVELKPSYYNQAVKNVDEGLRTGFQYRAKKERLSLEEWEDVDGDVPEREPEKWEKRARSRKIL